MDSEIIKQSIDSITEKIGEEQAAKIADDLGIIKVAVKEGVDTITAREERIKDLETTNTQLISANAGLLKKIPLNDENKLVPRTEPEQAPVPQYVDPFDEWGRLKK